MLTSDAKTVSNSRRSFLTAAGAAAAAGILAPGRLLANESHAMVDPLTAAGDSSTTVHYKTARINDLDIFYREAGPQDAPVILLLHGFPTSSNMYRNLIPRLAGSYHVIAPDYPGYGQSSMPDHKTYAYTFANFANVVDQLLIQLNLPKYSMYVMDYGAPTGYRLALKHPERVQALIIQNGNAYTEGLLKFWDPFRAYWTSPTPENREKMRGLLDAKSTRWQYEHGVSDLTLLDPTCWLVDQYGMDRPGNQDIQLDLFLDYGTNVPLYPDFQAFFRKYQPPALIVWGKNDFIFPPEGAAPYSRDLKNVETHLLDTGHFALETNGQEIADRMLGFLAKNKISRS
jgi:pimeloyl-ACP methyl ester carboxylesterase